MLKKIDNIIAIVMIVYLFCMLFNKFIAGITAIFCILLIIRVLRDKRIVPIILASVLLSLMVYNYLISRQYFSLGLEVLSSKSNTEYLIRMLTFSMMLDCFSDREILTRIYKELRKYVNWFLYIIIAYEFLVLLLLATGKSFIYRWGMNVFVGLNGSPHGNAYLMILVAVIIEWIVSEKNNKYLFLYLIPFIAAFISGARTPAVVMVCIFLGIRFFKNGLVIRRRIQMSWKRLIIITCFFICMLLCSKSIFDFIVNSNVVDKFLSTSDSGNVLNSRDMIWAGILNDFKYNFSDFQRAFGHGIHYSVIINLYNVHSPIWGHSDFIDILVSYGLITLGIYMAMYIRYFIKLWIIARNILLDFIFFIGMMLLSIFNGVINYTVFISIVAFWAIFYISTNKVNLGEN